MNQQISARTPPHWLNWLVVFVSVFIFTDAMVANGFIPIPIFFLRVAMALLSILLIALDYRQVGKLAFVDWSLIALLVLTIISTVWSLEPALTFQRAVSLATATLLGYYIAARYTLREQIHLYVGVMLLVLVLSFFFAVVLPQYGVHFDSVHFGRWRGVFKHKNELGRLAALIGILVLYLPRRTLVDMVPFGLPLLPMRIAIFGFACVVLFFAESAAALVVLGAMLVMVPVYYAFRLGKTLQLSVAHLLLAGLLLTSLWFATNRQDFFTFLGRDETLTGRTITWQIVLEAAQQRPLTGYGYSAGFTETSPTVVDDPRGWTPPHAHNEWLDVLLELGIPGVLLLFYNFAMKFFLTVRASQQEDYEDWSFVFIFLLNFALMSVVEATAFRLRDYTWIIFVSTTLLLLMRFMPQRGRQHVPEPEMSTSKQSLQA